MITAPYWRAPVSVTRVMGWVLLALIPAIVLHVIFFGPVLLAQLLLASVAAVVVEALLLWVRRRPIVSAVTDLSAAVTAWLLVLALPTTVPWWLTLLGVVIAIGVAKQLYCGIGQNPFNPAMVAFAALIVSFPAELSRWPLPTTPVAWQWASFLGTPNVDALASATVLDTLRTAVHSGQAVSELLGRSPVFGTLSGAGYEWIAVAFLAGGLLLWLRGIIPGRLPFAFLLTLGVLSTLAWLVAPERFAPPWVHLFAYSTMLAAFFIITDPVSGVVTPRGQWVFAAGAALLVFLIRHFGQFPDGVAFAVLLMNLAAPWIEMKTQPRVFGEDHP